SHPRAPHASHGRRRRTGRPHPLPRGGEPRGAVLHLAGGPPERPRVERHGLRGRQGSLSRIHQGPLDRHAPRPPSPADRRRRARRRRQLTRTRSRVTTDPRSPARPNPWVVLPRPNPSARLRLFCFPYAGGGASIYAPWGRLLPADVEV